MFTKKLFLIFPYFLMIFAGLAVPSDGEHGFLNIKSLSFLSTFLFISGYIVLKPTLTLYQCKLFIFLSVVLTFLFCSFALSLYYNETTSIARIDQFKLFLITILFPIMTLYLIDEKKITAPQVFLTVIYASFTYILIKIALITLHILHVIDLWSIMEGLGIRYMRMSIHGNLERVQTSVDIAAPFIIFFVLQAKRLHLNLSKNFTFFYVLLSLFSTFLSFSRYLMAVYLLSCFLYLATLHINKLLFLCLALIGIGLAGYVTIGHENVSAVVERRIFSQDNYISDLTRIKQIDAMIEQMKIYPYFGTGLGGYAPQYIRESSVLHLYEVQWVAFAMQFGLIGLYILILPLVTISLKYFKMPLSRKNLAFLGVFLIWVLSGFTNPFLISLTSGILYTLFYLSSDLINKQKLEPIRS